MNAKVNLRDIQLTGEQMRRQQMLTEAQQEGIEDMFDCLDGEDMEEEIDTEVCNFFVVV